MTRDELSDNDQREIEKFTIFTRACGQAALAGVPLNEAMVSIYEDMYPEDAAELAALAEDDDAG